MKPRFIMFAATAVGVWLCGCCTIRQPIVTDVHDQELAVDVAGDIRGWQATGQFTVDYRNKFRTEYAKLNDANVTLYLLLQAIECESRHGNKALARQMLEFAREEAARHDAGTNAATRTPLAEDILRTEARIHRNLAAP